MSERVVDCMYCMWPGRVALYDVPYQCHGSKGKGAHSQGGASKGTGTGDRYRVGVDVVLSR